MPTRTLALALVLGLLTAASAADPAKKKPADPLGYGAAFDAELARIGQITPQQFAARYLDKAKYLAQLSWDATTAKHFDALMLDPAKLPLDRKKFPPPLPHLDTRLNDAELAMLKRNGFVVSERLGTRSFGEQFYKVYSRDLPVFISADAMLQAWHHTYDSMLMELEETYFSATLDEMLTAMAKELPRAKSQYGDGILSECLTDADFFIATARSLLAGKAMPLFPRNPNTPLPPIVPVPTVFDQGDRVLKALTACRDEQLNFKYPLFGRPRDTDFSQFKPRGHYTHSMELAQYFQAMMWLGRIDLRVAGNPEEASPRELGAAIVLHDLLVSAGQFDNWKSFDRMLQTFVGKTDSMTFSQLGAVLQKAGIKTPAEVKTFNVLETIQADIEKGKYGTQEIRGDVYTSPFGPEKIRLPRSFTFLGQKFVLDSWAMAKLVYDDILWDGEKVQRRLPSCLDVAFSVLGNDAVVPDLAGRMTDPTGKKFRDGLNYQHNLAAVRNVIDAQDKGVWSETIYAHWLACLRELATPTTDAKYPEAMRTRTWAMKSLNTQLASWTQLRHDTVLYVKQSYTSRALCEYPAGYVEPHSAFWARFETMLARSADLIEKTPFSDRTINKYGVGVKLKDVQKKQVAFLRGFAQRAAILKGMAEKELAQKPFDADEVKCFKAVVEGRGGSGSPRYDGWYPKLFYNNPHAVEENDSLVTDVHTDLPDDTVADPGCVLHQGVGKVDMLIIAVDSGPNRMVYAGPVLSHFEFTAAGTTRHADHEWQGILNGKTAPSRPAWTKEYLVPEVRK